MAFAAGTPELLVITDEEQQSPDGDRLVVIDGTSQRRLGSRGTGAIRTGPYRRATNSSALGD